MITIGFVTNFTGPSGVYRGMDAYAKYLWEHLARLEQKNNIKFVEINDHTQLHKQACDLYHFPVFSVYFPNIPLAFHKPYVVTVHDVTRLEFPDKYPAGAKGKIQLELQKILLHKSKFVITDSFSSVSQVRRFLQIPHSKIKMVYLAAAELFLPQKDRTKLSNTVKKYHLPENFVLFNGDIDWNKNLTGLARACSLLSFPLVIYGSSSKNFIDHPGKYDARHAELSHLPKLYELLKQKNVSVLGFVPDEDLVQIFNLATLYCQPSFAEGFGIPVLQALACGTPVACSRTHSLPEVAGDAALYFDPYNVNSLTSVLKQLLEDKKLRSSLTSKGFIQAGKFSWEKTAADTITVYQEALAL